MFQRLKVSTRLLAAFGTLVLLAVILSGYGLYSMASVQEQLTSIADVNNPEGTYAETMRFSISQAAAYNRNLALLSDEKLMALEHGRMKQALVDYDEAEAALAKMFQLDETTEREHKAFAALKVQKDKTLPLIARAAALGLANKNEEAAKMLTEVLQPVQQEWLDQLGALVKLEATLNGEAGAEAHATYQRARWIFVGITGLAVVVATVLALLVTRSLTRQLGGEPADLAELAGAMAQGDLSREIALGKAPGHSVMQAMATMQHSLRQVHARSRIAV